MLVLNHDKVKTLTLAEVRRDASWSKVIPDDIASRTEGLDHRR